YVLVYCVLCKQNPIAPDLQSVLLVRHDPISTDLSRYCIFLYRQPGHQGNFAPPNAAIFCRGRSPRWEFYRIPPWNIRPCASFPPDQISFLSYTRRNLARSPSLQSTPAPCNSNYCNDNAHQDCRISLVYAQSANPSHLGYSSLFYGLARPSQKNTRSSVNRTGGSKAAEW